MVEIDGAYGEGGGQIVRAALFFSIALNKPFRVVNIRKGRRKPGLKRQHLNIIKTLLKISESEAVGAELGSTELEFYPGRVKGGRCVIDFKTAGSIPLYLQTLLPVLLFLEKDLRLEVKGGTDVPMGPTMDFTRFAFSPFVRDSGADFEVAVIRRGFYPEGGGVVVVSAGKGALNSSPLKIERKNLKKVTLYSVASRSLKGRKVAHRQLISAERFVKERLNLEVNGHFSYEDSPSPGSAVTIVAEFEGKAVVSSDALGAPGKPSEKVGREAAERFAEGFLSGASVDVHLADHLVPLIALRGGGYTVSHVTKHLETAVWVANKFVPDRVRMDGRKITAVKG